VQPPTPKVDLEHNGKSQLSGGGSKSKRRNSNGNENHANKRQAVEASDQSLPSQRSVSLAMKNDLPHLEGFVPLTSIAPADTFRPVQRTKTLPFIQSIPGIFDPAVLEPQDIAPEGTALASGSAGGDADSGSAWNEGPTWKVLCQPSWETHDNLDDDELWAQYFKLPDK
jgi:hypothetical protein